MRTHDRVVSKLLKRPAVRKEVERIEREEGALLDLLLGARHEAGLSSFARGPKQGAEYRLIVSTRRWRLLRLLRSLHRAPDVSTPFPPT